MGMLKSISLENYKCFKDKIDIEIAPLTVLCGVNSSGKSSILKSLLMLKQSYENESNSHTLLLTGEYVDNGSFDDVVYHENKKDIPKDATFKISNTYLIRDTSNEYGKNPIKRQDLVSFKELKRVFYQQKNIRNVKAFELSIDIEVLRPNETSSPFEFYIESNIIKNYNIDIKLLDISGEPIDEVQRYVYIRKDIENYKDPKCPGWFLSCNGIPSAKGNNVPQNDYPCTCYFSGLQITNLYANNMNRDTVSTLPNLLSIFKIASFQTDGLNFIAPLREQPIRRYSINGDINSVGISGEKTPILLAKEFDNTKTDCLPPIFDSEMGKTYWNKEKNTFSYLISQWMNYLSLGNITLVGNKGLVEVNINEHNIADVGFGVSQTLPILVQGLYMTKDQTLLLEQPEIHLHPEMQLQIADFLIALALNEKNIIVETHSDHIINRIVYQLVNDKTGKLKDTIKIMFIDKDADEPENRIIPINIEPTKGIVNAPHKFFSQFARETQKIIVAAVKNRKR